MALKNIFKIFLIAVFVMGILNFAYADTGPYTGENQAKNIAQNYLNSHNSHYKVITATKMYELNDQKTNHVKWISSSQLDIMRKNNETFEGEPVDNYVGSGMNLAWKVNIANSEGKEIGNIWIDVYEAKIIKINLPSNNQNDTNSNKTVNATDTTIPTSQEPSGNNTGIIFGAITLIGVIGAGYFMYTRLM